VAADRKRSQTTGPIETVERLILVVAVVAVASAAAVMLQRRRPEAPTQGSWAVPSQLDRADFGSPSPRWLVVVFTSATCDTCEAALAKAQPLAGAAVTVVEAEVSAPGGLHRRYGIDAVPTLVVADADGVVRASIVGPPGASDLWSMMADLRDAAPDLVEPTQSGALPPTAPGGNDSPETGW